ncbi:MAG: hypothetical protein JWO30_4462 [Fibrobacteres bacterium]|nr:hypothetical protein [Fibrobacterota bacterium]
MGMTVTAPIHMVLTQEDMVAPMILEGDLIMEGDMMAAILVEGMGIDLWDSRINLKEKGRNKNQSRPSSTLKWTMQQMKEIKRPENKELGNEEGRKNPYNKADRTDEPRPSQPLLAQSLRR